MYRWEKSSHVEHLRKHTKEYVSAVHGFLDDVYFSKLPSSASASASDSDSNEVREEEDEEYSRGNDAKRAAVAK